MKEKIVDLYNKGYSYRQIQNELGCSKGTISYHLGHMVKEKTIERQRQKRNKIRQYIYDVKHYAQCADCREEYPYWVMDFDHMRDKSFAVSAFNTKNASLEQVIEEISKCEIVCSNCHRNRTHQRTDPEEWQSGRLHRS